MGTFYTNADGLQLQYGTRKASLAGKNSAGSSLNKHIVVDFDGVDLVDTGPVIDLSAARLPAGAYITAAILYVKTTFTSGGLATLDVGTFKASDGATALSINGLIAASAVAGLTAGAVITGAGAQVNTLIAEDTYIIPTYNVAAFTAGRGRLIVTYRMGL